jgi:hypothetical protein
MTYYAVFEPTADEPRPIIGWIDTTIADYALPPEEGLLTINQEQWDGRMSGQWAVTAGNMVPVPVDNTPSPEQAANEELGSRLSQGITFQSSNSALDGVKFALDQTTLDQIGSVARDFAAGLGLPNDVNVFVYPDYNGSPVAMSGEEVVKVYRAMRNLVSTLNMQAAVMAHGGPPAWPSHSVTI